MLKARRGRRKGNKKALIIGAGPAGLASAAHLGAEGLEVLLIEAESDPRVVVQVDERSFNYTYNTLGLESGPFGSVIRSLGQPVYRREVHFESGKTVSMPYGFHPRAMFFSVPRHESLVGCVNALPGSVAVQYGTRATEVDPDQGLATLEPTTDSGRDEAVQLGPFDLVVFADGQYGVGRQIASRNPSAGSSREPNKVSYLRFEIRADQAEAHDLSPEALHVWPGDSLTAIGVPNHGGSQSVLLMGEFGKKLGVFFDDEQHIADVIERFNPRLRAVVPLVAHQLSKARLGFFVSALGTTFRVGRRGVLVGESGRVAPPYAGLGANSAEWAARTLRDAYRRSEGNVERALADYEEVQLAASPILLRLVQQHGNLLTKGLTPRAAVISNYLSRCRFIFDQSTLYQRICLEPGGLDRLVERVIGRSISDAPSERRHSSRRKHLAIN